MCFDLPKQTLSETRVFKKTKNTKVTASPRLQGSKFEEAQNSATNVQHKARKSLICMERLHVALQIIKCHGVRKTNLLETGS